ncbi:hypothetical protein PV08_10375 [Exophiala spinifera]|uniref:5-demethoxyubiquinone hydroxylase, mitochondrial n=1 Tax=Exophiala spinifera TaxID=91928 RepID=A0A0D1Y813_9EURO|nr:uncharacterized protein PV08_10375 [Exophiala spinifera]KIW11076.1 hypothetical protein PV08_10375 [Exophiala spinifera]
MNSIIWSTSTTFFILLLWENIQVRELSYAMISCVSPLALSRLGRASVLRAAKCGMRRVSSQSEASSRSSHTTTQSRTILTEEQRRFLDSALRVNQAGELAATLIYTAQTPPVVKAHPHLRPLMKHMYDQEAGHFKTFNELLAKHRIRPTAMYPVWQAAATILGWTTGVMGREAAMACTEAVETEIGDHYNGQVREMFKWMQDLQEKGEELDPELKVLIDDIKRIRDEELEHLDYAVENDAKEAQPYQPLTDVIRYGCKGAIWISERI